MNLNVISVLWACPFGSCFSFQVLILAGFSLQSLTHFLLSFFFFQLFQPPKKLKKNQQNCRSSVSQQGYNKRSFVAPLLYCHPLCFRTAFFFFVFSFGVWLCVWRVGFGSFPFSSGAGFGVCWFFFLFVVVVSSSSSVLPSGVVRVLAGARSVGFCGSRSVVPPPSVWSAVASVVPASLPVSCGCVPGLCALARASFPSASVFRASSFGFGRGAFARRSVALVRSVRAGSLPLWVSFPGRACPPGLLPSSSPGACFCGLGSGSWASLAFALGLGVPALLFLPSGVRPPAGWGFVSLGSGWFFRP